jgi:hypothetical protein
VISKYLQHHLSAQCRHAVMARYGDTQLVCAVINSSLHKSELGNMLAEIEGVDFSLVWHADAEIISSSARTSPAQSPNSMRPMQRVELCDVDGLCAELGESTLDAATESSTSAASGGPSTPTFVPAAPSTRNYIVASLRSSPFVLRKARNSPQRQRVARPPHAVVDVAKLAALQGGGGHKNASAFRFNGTIDQLVRVFGKERDLPAATI